MEAEPVLAMTQSLRAQRGGPPSCPSISAASTVRRSTMCSSFSICRMADCISPTSAPVRNPSRPMFTPRIGVSCVPTRWAVLRSVPSPPNESTTSTDSASSDTSHWS